MTARGRLDRLAGSTSHPNSSALGVRPKIDFLSTDHTREVIHIGLSGTVGVG